MHRWITTSAGMLVAALGAAGTARGQATPLDVPRTLQLTSKALGETRTIDVALPAGYDTHPERRYPVVVVLDGEFEFGIAAATVRFYATMSQLPQMIVVGVRNTHRTRDLTPAPIAGFTPPEQDAGGAERFLAFLADELIPYIDSSFRTAPLRVLVGHSLGGLFALHTIGHRPALFTGYVVMEPASWWNNRRPIADAAAALRAPAARRARVMMVNGESVGADTTQWGGRAPMLRQIRVTGETHESMALAGLMQGLRTMFADFRPAGWRPGTHPIEMLERFDSLQERVGYAPAIPAESYSLAVRMSLDSRYFDDADRALTRMEKALGPTDETREFRGRLARERTTPVPAGFVQLEIPAHRPTPKEAAAFLGHWTLVGSPGGHDIDVRASGDTIIVHDRVALGEGQVDDADNPVIQVTNDGTLEWGLRWFNGIAALLVLRGHVQPDGAMTVTRVVRGWVPKQNGPEFSRVERYRRVAAPAGGG
jgi:predicted alpha/beta superfamily hydrolase